MSLDQSLIAPPDRVLSTLEKDGSRRWMYPRLARGRFLSRRRWVAYVLLALFTLIPFAPLLKVGGQPLVLGGKPLLLLDVVHRRFTFFGVTFLPTDTVLLALFMLTVLLSVFFVTALLGRVWCGWACPQTVYMEFVFRPIERLFTGRAGRGGRPAADVPAWRKALMYAAFLVVCLHLANTFLAYFVPADVLHTWITSSPAAHPAGFAIVAVVTALMLFDFCLFREQTCIIACPYGRLQSVLLDKWSLIISYDGARGEPRTRQKAKKAASCQLPVASKQASGGLQLPVVNERSAPATGNSQLATGSSAATGNSSADCIDCTLCVQVCPTGIDIRDGLQVECIGCAQCIDACDEVMDRLGRPRGLVRYSSQSAIAGEKTRVLRPRVVIYSVIVTGLLGLLGTLLVARPAADVTVLRAAGRPFVVLGDGTVENPLRVKIVNRTDKPQEYAVSIAGRTDVRALPERPTAKVGPGESVTEVVRVWAPPALFVAGRGHLDVDVRVQSIDKTFTADRTCRLLGPTVPAQGVADAGK